jgi:hypothetical protein
LSLLSSRSAVQEEMTAKTQKRSSKFMIRAVADLPAEKQWGDLGPCIHKENDGWRTARKGTSGRLRCIQDAYSLEPANPRRECSIRLSCQ